MEQTACLPSAAGSRTGACTTRPPDRRAPQRWRASHARARTARSGHFPRGHSTTTTWRQRWLIMKSVTADLTQWTGVPRPQRVALDGRYTRLEPLSADRHEATLFESARQPGAEQRFAYLFDEVPADADA